MRDIAGQYISIINPVIPIPLSRFLPPLPQNIVTRLLNIYLPISNDGRVPIWIIDPFFASPFIPVEITQASYNVIAVSNNPFAINVVEK